MSTLTFKHVKKTYEGEPVIHDFTIDIADGEFIVVVGPSGCGKSTLLRMVAGLEETSAGEIILDNRVINRLAPKDRNIAMVFQNYALYPHMSVFDNMAYGLRMHGKDKVAIKKRVERTAEILELSQLLNRKPRELSGGQRQRVAMGRAIVRQPKLFLFDEPLSNLDAKLRVQMRLEIKKLQREFNTTSIYVTHDQVEAMTMADRLVVFNKGHTEQIGKPLELYEKPATKFVAGFIGSPSMNFLHATISADKQTVEVTGGTRFYLEERHKRLHANQKITVGIRPENIVQSNSDEAHSFVLHVSHIETLGADTLLYGTLPSNERLITVRLSGNIRPESGAKITLKVVSDALHLFDAESGRRLASE